MVDRRSMLDSIMASSESRIKKSVRSARLCCAFVPSLRPTGFVTLSCTGTLSDLGSGCACPVLVTVMIELVIAMATTVRYVDMW